MGNRAYPRAPPTYWQPPPPASWQAPDAVKKRPYEESDDEFLPPDERRAAKKRLRMRKKQEKTMSFWIKEDAVTKKVERLMAKVMKCHTHDIPRTISKEIVEFAKGKRCDGREGCEEVMFHGLDDYKQARKVSDDAKIKFRYSYQHKMFGKDRVFVKANGEIKFFICQFCDKGLDIQ